MNARTFSPRLLAAFVLFCCLFCPGEPLPAVAQLPGGQPPATRPAGPPTPAAQPSAPATQPQFKLDDLAWLAGQWTGQVPQLGRLEEHWSPPQAGFMLGMFRIIPAGGGNAVLELETLRELDGGVELRFRHFTPDLEPLEEKGQTPTLRLVELDETRAVFVDPTPEKTKPHHPHRLTMWRVGADAYRFRVDVLRDGQEKAMVEAELRRVGAGHPPAP